MIAQVVVDEIRGLLEEGELSQRTIARRVGVSRGTVHAIARGKRPDYCTLQHDTDDFLPPVGPLRRCPGCGGMVLMPCLLCHVRRMGRGRD